MSYALNTYHVMVDSMIMCFHIIVESTKHASHTYCVMVDSTIKLSMLLWIAPNMHGILIVLYCRCKVFFSYLLVFLGHSLIEACTL